MVYFEETCALIPADADKGILGAEIARLRIVDGVGCTVVYLVASEVVVDAQPSVTVLVPCNDNVVERCFYFFRTTFACLL